MHPAFVQAEARVQRGQLYTERPSWPGRHNCADHVVEVGTQPDPKGWLVVAETCELCGKVLRQYTDSVL